MTKKTATKNMCISLKTFHTLPEEIKWFKDECKKLKVKASYFPGDATCHEFRWKLTGPKAAVKRIVVKCWRNDLHDASKATFSDIVSSKSSGAIIGFKANSRFTAKSIRKQFIELQRKWRKIADDRRRAHAFLPCSEILHDTINFLQYAKSSYSSIKSAAKLMLEMKI